MLGREYAVICCMYAVELSFGDECGSSPAAESKRRTFKSCQAFKTYNMYQIHAASVSRWLW
jgi:hypothetical protein